MSASADGGGTALYGRRGRRVRAAWTVFASLAAGLGAWRRRARSRAVLARFGERELRDLGLTAADEAIGECTKPFWRE